jgi:DNA mismatch endonuclease, patch repair protein
MTDVLTPQQRSFNMSRIRGRDTRPETEVRAGLRAAGMRGYRTHSSLAGKPDIVFPSAKLAIFVDGCFWHKCPLDYQEPETRRDFWAKKINGNVDRDKKVDKILTDSGWKVLRIWEHEVRKSPESVVETITSCVVGASSTRSGSRN